MIYSVVVLGEDGTDTRYAAASPGGACELGAWRRGRCRTTGEVGRPGRPAAQLPDQSRTTEPYTGLSIRPQASYSSDRNIAAQKVKNMEIIAT